MDTTTLLGVSGLILAVALLAIKYGSGNGKRTARPNKKTSVPGIESSDADLGNLGDMGKAGSLHQFLLGLHEKYGDIVSFYWGKQLTVSISSPERFKEQSKFFDRPAELFALFKPLITGDSIQYTNGPEGQARYVAYSRCFSETAMNNYYAVIQQTTNETMLKLERLTEEEHVPLREYMFFFAIKTVLLAVYGENFNDDAEVLKLKRSYDISWCEMESQVSGDPPTQERLDNLKSACDYMHSTMAKIWKKAQENPSDDPKRTNFLDVIANLDISPEEKSADMVTVLVASFHTTGLLLTWCLYYIASHPEVQKRAMREVLEQIGEDGTAGPDDVNKLVYLRQVIDETMRCSVLAPYAARYSDDDTHLGGHTIPGGTPVIHALGASLQDPSRWPEPQKFDPERFSPSNRKNLPAFGFEPFGFAGKRKCMGYRFSLVEATIFLADLLRKFEVQLVPGQNVVPEHGLVTIPKDEIWVTFKARKG